MIRKKKSGIILQKMNEYLKCNTHLDVCFSKHFKQSSDFSKL